MTEAMAEITAGIPCRLCTPQVSWIRNFDVKNGYREVERNKVKLFINVSS